MAAQITKCRLMSELHRISTVILEMTEADSVSPPFLSAEMTEIGRNPHRSAEILVKSVQCEPHLRSHRLPGTHAKIL